jgi:hypothetical protein
MIKCKPGDTIAYWRACTNGREWVVVNKIKHQNFCDIMNDEKMFYNGEPIFVILELSE